MKKLFISLTLLISVTTFAQAPQGFNYQATVRNNTGNLIVNQNVYFKFNVMQGSSTSLPVFTETHYVPTDDLGAVNLIIGEGTTATGVFSEIDWSLGSYYLGIELDTGSGYVAMGTTQLLSVPYALYAAASGNATTTIPNLETVLAENNSANNQQIKNLLDPTEAQDAATKAYIDALIDSLQGQIDDLDAANVAPLPNVTIGTQIWSSTNLDVTTYRDGTPIPQVTDPTQWESLTTGAWCYYNNDPANNTTYGKLYNWYAVAGIHDNDPNTPNKVLAPQGWHVPTDAEWTTLIDFLGGEDFAGGQMKSTGTIQAGTGLWQDPNTEATNESSFTGLPAGYRSLNGAFYGIGLIGYWWSSSEASTSNAWTRFLDYNFGYAQSSFNGKEYGFSVRCLED